MRILFAASEAYPFASTGGLAGVTGSLPKALCDAGHDVSIIMPLYRDIEKIKDFRWVSGEFSTSAGEKFGLAESVIPGTGIPAYFVSKDEYFHRQGIYGPDNGSAYNDNAVRFAFFCRAVVAFHESLGEPPDVIHCHDWQTGLIPAYMRNCIRPAVVFTIHNMHFQGNFPPEEYGCTYLPRSLFTMTGLEFYGTFSFLKSGIVYADQVTTVSRTYAEEIQKPEFGFSLDGLLRERSADLTGILNGIDYDVWNPETDGTLAASYSAVSIAPRRKCRRELLKTHDLDPAGGELTAGVVSRLTGQKGLDLLFPIIGRLAERGVRFVILGTGDKCYMDRFSELALEHPGSVSVNLKYDEGMARRIFSGCDIIMMPSRFEPCGLAQMMGMRYGAVPLVNRTGGLADTVIDEKDGGFGFVMNGADPEELYECIIRASVLYGQRNRWAWLVKKCMKQNNSWKSRVVLFEDVYSRAVNSRKAR
ncbi:MAG: glycogen synthase GlgA [Candidatus Aegiribacteria sp.]|nr:glycogen synthase GlgA [Candidatus Aegiribacteria sp.]